MHLFLTLVAFFLIFSLLILIHEAGHFFAAKRAGVKVEEFGFGLPPKIFSIKKGETEYSLNWIPFGGFVRMLGEDTGTKKSLGARSFAAQPLRTRAWIVSAGVIMNLFLAWVLLTLGFLVGIEPLIASEEDFLAAVHEGQVNVEPGLLITESREEIRTVDYNGKDLQIRSFDPGDRLLTLDRKPLVSYQQWEAVTAHFTTEGGGQIWVEMDRADGVGGAEILTTDLFKQISTAPVYFARLHYLDQPNSIFHGILQTGDLILSINGTPVFDEKDLKTLEPDSGQWTVEYYRPGVGKSEFQLTAPAKHPVIAYLSENAPASQAGLQIGDEVLDLSGESIFSAEQLMTFTQDWHKEHLGEPLIYMISRSGEKMTFEIQPNEEGLVGVILANKIQDYGSLSLYSSPALHTLMGVEKVQYGWQSPFKAVSEMWRLGKATAVMFADVMKEFLSFGGVPEGVSGPVGIAKMTGVTLEEGWQAMLRFVAMLSLSLGVINILPIPALDGGRLLFIVLEAFTGRKPSPRLEHFIHSTGFILLILFLVYITWNDVLSLF
jgi:regulator of sigma E protease